MGHHPEVTPVHALAAELLEQAHAHHSGRAARTIVSSTSQRATVIALAGSELAEHDSPPAATMHLLAGRVRLYTAEREWFLKYGDVMPAPPERHAVQALGEAVVLLTVALR